MTIEPNFFDDPVIKPVPLDQYQFVPAFLFVIENGSGSDATLQKRKEAALRFLNTCVPRDASTAVVEFGPRLQWVASFGDARSTAGTIAGVQSVHSYTTESYSLLSKASRTCWLHQEFRKPAVPYFVLYFGDGFTRSNDARRGRIRAFLHAVSSNVFALTSSKVCNRQMLREIGSVYAADNPQACAEACLDIRKHYLKPAAFASNGKRRLATATA